MWEKFQEWWVACKTFFYSLILSIKEIIKDCFIWLFDNFMGLAVTALNGLGDFFSGLNFTQYINAIPADVKTIMGLIGLDTATSMIVAAIIIRMLLQLIPFVRLGS